MRYLIAVLALTLAASTTGAAARPASHQATRSAEIDAYLQRRMTELHVPGIAMVAIVDGRVTYQHAFGLRDVAQHAPVTLDTLFPIGSATKSFTAMAAVLSQDADVLTLDDHPQRYLPYFHMAEPDSDARVTLRDMLSHQTGLMAKADLAAVSPVLTREEYIRAATSAVPTAPLRTRFQYSNAMFTAAGEAVAAANHTSWEDLIQTRIFAPLGMRESVPNLRDIGHFPDHVTGYIYSDATKTWTATPPTFALQEMAPAGSIASSAHDMTRWLMMLANGGAVRGHRFVSEAGFHQLTSPQIAMNARMSYGLGWVLYSWNNLHVVEHNGGGEGISALVSFIPERRAGFVLLLNCSPTALTTITAAGRDLYPLILNLPPEPVQVSVTTPPTAHIEAPPQPIAESADHLIARMIRAGGGEQAMRRHETMRMVIDKSYDNQGVSAAVTLSEQGPASWEDSEVWSAAGHEIARLRVYFDGAHGGQETNFGQDALNDAATNASLRRTSALHPLLEIHALYPQIAVSAGPDVNGQHTYALTLGVDGKNEQTLIVAVDSAVILRRITDTAADDLSDYRAIDGELVPFRIVTHDALGQTTQTVREAQFNTAIPASAFAAQAPSAPH
ncbi:MAG: serine hydrolase domain-containing protein [Alphaproteobacteria bacterium]